MRYVVLIAFITITLDSARALAQEAGSARAGENGFALASAGDQPAYVLRFQGTLQVDGRLYLDDSALNTVLIRRARPILSGTVLGLVDFYLMPDFGGGTTALFDAYLDAHPFAWLRLRVGKFKAPIGLERLQSDADLHLPERALASDLSPVRDVGAQLWGEVARGVITYSLALLAGTPDSANIDVDNGGNKDIAGRVWFRPFAYAPELGSLGVGVAATHGARDGSVKDPSLVPYKTVGQTTLFSYAKTATDPDASEFAAGTQNRLNPELFYYYASFGVLAEMNWSRQQVHQLDAAQTLTHRAWAASASYVLGGTNAYSGATPNNAWDPQHGHWGAVEFAIRYSFIHFDADSFPVFADPSVSARRAQELGVSTNWVLSRMLRVVLNFEHTTFRGGAGAPDAVANRSAENMLLMRGQLNF